MFSIEIDKDIYHGVDMINVDELIPHEKVVENKKNILKYNLKYRDKSIIISSIIICRKSNVIIDGHHRFTALKELNFNKIPVTKINYLSEKIRVCDDNSILKEDVINNAKKGKLYEPKSTKHSIRCNLKKEWVPVTLISSLFELRLD